MDPKELFAKAVNEATGCAMRVEASQLGNKTPCTDWDLRTLLNHMVYELMWVPDLLAGKTVAEVGTKYDGDLLGSDVGAAWKKAADAAVEAVKTADMKATVHLSYGDKPTEYYVRESAGDILIHGWDLSQAINCSLMFESTVAQVVYDDMLTKKDMITNSGLFGPEINVPDNSSIEVKLLGLVGRKTEVA